VFRRHIAMALILLGIILSGNLRAQETGERDAPAAGEVADVLIEVKDYPGTQRGIVSLAKDLISLEKGMPFSQEALEDSVSLLELSGRFEEVGTEVRKGESGIVVAVRLKPCLMIQDINISGEYPLFEQDILNVMTLYAGNYLKPGAPEEQERLITEFLAAEGFISPKVSVRVDGEGKDGTVVLRVDIDKSRYYRLHSLTVTGNRTASDNRIKLRMSTWRRSFFLGSSGRFVEKTLTEDVKNLTSFYWSRGYADASVTYSVDRNPETGDVDVTLNVREGPLYEVSFPGSEQFWKVTLRKKVTIFQEGNRSGGGVRRSAREIRELYQENGFPDAKVKAVEETGEEDGRAKRTVAFTVDEGPRAYVSHVGFSGNTAFSEEELAGKVGTGQKTFPLFGKRLFNRDVLMQDIRILKTLYTNRGYGDVEVGADLKWSSDRKEVSVTFVIKEGVQTLVSSVAFEGITTFPAERARECIGMKEGSPFTQTALKNDEGALATCISERGYPHVKVKSSVELSRDRKTASVRYLVDEGPAVVMGRTFFSGNFKTRRRVLQKALDMDQGDPFSLSKMVQAQNDLRDMNVFNAVRFKTLGLREGRDEVTVFAELEEKKPYYVQSSVGYESNAGLYGNARVGDRNLLGLNRDIWLGGEASEVNKRVELGVNAPRIWGTHATGVYNLFWERREDYNLNFGLDTLGYNLGLVKRYGRRVYASLNFRYERRNQFIVDEALQEELDAQKSAEELEDQAESLKPRSVFVVTPGITYDTRDSFMQPKRGTYATASVDISTELLNSRDVDDFIRYRADVRQYVSPFDRLTFAWAGRAGYIMPTRDTEQISDDQLFYLGGALNVRGYRENLLLFDESGSPVGGRLSLSSSIEARFRVIDGIELALFYDIGTVRGTTVAPVVPNTRSSYGTGVRYLTPIGPISLVYGRKTDPEPQESPYEWHFSVGYTF